MACAMHAAGMAAQMADHLSKSLTYDSQLHVIYLANDVLLKGQEQPSLHMLLLSDCRRSWLLDDG